VLVATVRGPSGEPHTKLDYGLQTKKSDGVTGSLAPIFTHASRRRSRHTNWTAEGAAP